MPTPSDVLAELSDAGSPLASAYAAPKAAGNAVALADLLDARTGAGSASVARPDVSRGDLVKATTGNGARKALEAAAADPSSAGYEVARAALPFLTDSDSLLDYTDAGTRALVDALGPGGYAVLTQAQHDAVVSACTRTGSRAEVLWGHGAAVSADDVRRAINGGVS